MKNVSINESISFESTIASPSKPHPCSIVKRPKPIFLVNCVGDNISSNTTKKSSDSSLKKNSNRRRRLKSNKNSTQNNNSLKNNKSNEFHMLDFDALFNDIIHEKKKPLDKSAYKKSHLPRNYSKKKLIGSKRIRLFSYKNSINKKTHIKKKKFNISSISKGQSFQNNNYNHYDIYDINNFCSYTMKIREKSLSHNVVVPSFEELSDDFFEDNNIEDYEDISDNIYLKYHNIFEQKEIDYRIQVSHNLEKKSPKKS